LESDIHSEPGPRVEALAQQLRDCAFAVERVLGGESDGLSRNPASILSSGQSATSGAQAREWANKYAALAEAKDAELLTAQGEYEKIINVAFERLALIKELETEVAAARRDAGAIKKVADEREKLVEELSQHVRSLEIQLANVLSAAEERKKLVMGGDDAEIQNPRVPN
jgi:hypothetical protein